MENAKLFNKWSYDVKVDDIGLKDYIAIEGKAKVHVPHTAGRYAIRRFKKAQCPIVERLVNSLMMHGRNNGKKMLTIRTVKHAFEIIHLLTGENPIQVFINALANVGPREDSCRVGSAGAVRRQSVDVSPFRRVNTAIYWIVSGSRSQSFRKSKTMAEILAKHIVDCANREDCFAINKKRETERVAKINR